MGSQEQQNVSIQVDLKTLHNKGRNFDRMLIKERIFAMMNLFNKPKNVDVFIAIIRKKDANLNPEDIASLQTMGLLYDSNTLNKIITDIRSNCQSDFSRMAIYRAYFVFMLREILIQGETLSKNKDKNKTINRTINDIVQVIYTKSGYSNDVNDFNNYINEILNMGIDELKKVQQSFYDEWRRLTGFNNQIDKAEEKSAHVWVNYFLREDMDVPENVKRGFINYIKHINPNSNVDDIDWDEVKKMKTITAPVVSVREIPNDKPTTLVRATDIGVTQEEMVAILNSREISISLAGNPCDQQRNPFYDMEWTDTAGNHWILCGVIEADGLVHFKKTKSDLSAAVSLTEEDIEQEVSNFFFEKVKLKDAIPRCFTKFTYYTPKPGLNLEEAEEIGSPPVTGQQANELQASLKSDQMNRTPPAPVPPASNPNTAAAVAAGSAQPNNSQNPLPANRVAAGVPVERTPELATADQQPADVTGNIPKGGKQTKSDVKPGKPQEQDPSKLPRELGEIPLSKEFKAVTYPPSEQPAPVVTQATTNLVQNSIESYITAEKREAKQPPGLNILTADVEDVPPANDPPEPAFKEFDLISNDNKFRVLMMGKALELGHPGMRGKNETDEFTMINNEILHKSYAVTKTNKNNKDTYTYEKTSPEAALENSNTVIYVQNQLPPSQFQQETDATTNIYDKAKAMREYQILKTFSKRVANNANKALHDDKIFKSTDQQKKIYEAKACVEELSLISNPTLIDEKLNEANNETSLISNITWTDERAKTSAIQRNLDLIRNLEEAKTLNQSLSSAPDLTGRLKLIVHKKADTLAKQLSPENLYGVNPEVVNSFKAATEALAPEHKNEEVKAELTQRVHENKNPSPPPSPSSSTPPSLK